MKRVRVRDIKQGRVVYVVRGVAVGDAHVEKIEFASRPYMEKYTDSLFVKFKFMSSWGEMLTATTSLVDMNVVPNGYNYHKAFWKQHQAQAYADRINSGCVSPTELKRITVHAEIMELDDMYYGWYEHEDVL